ncbi:uncharacterized protein BROUX77_005383 [Berkeleyomyces rouxiae]|uniref:uncharacterized protein n=1 Tax=Berkeleyomyces rouxiae TaxID=2035830 RepID=UPI003B7F1205
MSPSFSSLLATALVASQAVLALPTSSSESLGESSSSPAGSWSIKQARDVHQTVDGAVSLAELYSKYEVLMPHKFLIPTKIGRAGRSIYNLIFDTSAIGIWVHSRETANPKALQSPYIQHRYFPGHLVDGYSWKTNDPNGNIASGIGYVETVSIGGLEVRDQTIQVAQTAPSHFNDFQSVSGVLGFALSASGKKTFYPDFGLFENALFNLGQDVITVDMKHCSTGRIDIGMIEELAYNGFIGYSKVVAEGNYWNFTAQILGDFDVKNLDYNKIKGQGLEKVVADSASDLLMLPTKYIEEYYQEVDRAFYSKIDGGYVFPCDSKLPDFTFMSGNTRIAIPGRYLKLNHVDKEFDICFEALQSSEELGINILGGPAFKSAFVVFNPMKSESGWARKDLMDEQSGW